MHNQTTNDFEDFHELLKNTEEALTDSDKVSDAAHYFQLLLNWMIDEDIVPTNLLAQMFSLLPRIFVEHDDGAGLLGCANKCLSILHNHPDRVLIQLVGQAYLAMGDHYLSRLPSLPAELKKGEEGELDEKFIQQLLQKEKEQPHPVINANRVLATEERYAGELYGDWVQLTRLSREAIVFYRKAISIAQAFADEEGIVLGLTRLGDTLMRQYSFEVRLSDYHTRRESIEASLGYHPSPLVRQLGMVDEEEVARKHRCAAFQTLGRGYQREARRKAREAALHYQCVRNLGQKNTMLALHTDTSALSLASIQAMLFYQRALLGEQWLEQQVV